MGQEASLIQEQAVAWEQVDPPSSSMVPLQVLAEVAVAAVGPQSASSHPREPWSKPFLLGMYSRQAQRHSRHPRGAWP